MASRPISERQELSPPAAGSAAPTVRSLTVDREVAWNRYVEREPSATFFHGLAWRRIVEANYPFRAHYLLAEREGEICGVLPLFEIANLLVKTTLVSVPFGVYGGVAAADDAAMASLLARVRALSGELGVSYCELRQMDMISATGFRRKDGYATFIRDLPEDPQECLLLLPRKARAAVRQARDRHRLEFSVGHEQLDEFYRLFVHNKRHLGSPVLSLRFFRSLLVEFGENVDVMIVRQGEKALAGVVSFFDGDSVIPYYSGSLHEHEALQINNFMYLKLMERGASLGCKSFDFGRSRVESGSFRFKRHQGFEPRPLHYQYYLERATELPNLSPSNPRFRLAEEVWKRLPMVVVRALGPKLVRYFV